MQAKNLLLGTGLAQQTLAGVWNLADIDKDGQCHVFLCFWNVNQIQAAIIDLFTGKLNTEEFCVAMHLCEQFQKGEPLPPQLPVRLPSLSMARNKLALQPHFFAAWFPHKCGEQQKTQVWLEPLAVGWIAALAVLPALRYLNQSADN